MATWVDIYSDNQSSLYIEDTTIRHDGNKTKFWTLRNYKAKQYFLNRVYLSSKTQFEFDCSKETMRIITGTLYSRGMGDGMVTYIFSNNPEHEPIIPETVGGSLWNIACNLHDAQ